MRDKLTAPLAAIFRDKHRPETEHTLATNILADYASDDPTLLADLLMDADPKAYAASLPRRRAARRRRRCPCSRPSSPGRRHSPWNDPPLDPSWTKPDAALVSRIEGGQGLLAERFAFCQTMPLDEFLTTAEGLRKSGYRPVRFRPYADGQAVRVAAVWTRDGRNWRIASGLTPERGPPAGRAEPARQVPPRRCRRVRHDRRGRQARRPLRGPLGREDPATTTPGSTSG